MSITAIASFYAASATSAVRSAAASQGTVSTAETSGTSGTTSTDSTTVSISKEARQAAAGGIAVPESIRQDALAELNRVFPQDILDEAKARL